MNSLISKLPILHIVDNLSSVIQESWTSSTIIFIKKSFALVPLQYSVKLLISKFLDIQKLKLFLCHHHFRITLT